MDCLTTTNSLKINYKKSIGTVVLIVEGSDDEFELLRKIFLEIFGYVVITKSRNKKIFREYNVFVRKGNENDRIIIINTSSSNIGSIYDLEFRNNLYKMVYEKYGLDLKNKPVYYIWDRDAESNDKDKTENLLSILKNPDENDNFENGILLISYPAIESYIVSCFNDESKYVDGHIKNYVTNNNYYISDITGDLLLKAVVVMHKKMLEMGIRNYNLDKFYFTNKKIFDIEEEIYIDKGKYQLLSLLSFVFLDLGLITSR